MRLKLIFEFPHKSSTSHRQHIKHKLNEACNRWPVKNIWQPAGTTNLVVLCTLGTVEAQRIICVRIELHVQQTRTYHHTSPALSQKQTKTSATTFNNTSCHHQENIKINHLINSIYKSGWNWEEKRLHFASLAVYDRYVARISREPVDDVLTELSDHRKWRWMVVVKRIIGDRSMEFSLIIISLWTPGFTGKTNLL